MSREGRVFMIDGRPADGVDRALLCQVAVETPFETVCATDPDRYWTGEEGEFWQIRVGATMAGWTPVEIEEALLELAGNRHLGRLANRIVDEQILDIKRTLEPDRPLPDPPSSRPWVLLGGAIVAAGFGLAMMVGLT
jgi:hypothetical protein